MNKIKYKKKYATKYLCKKSKFKKKKIKMGNKSSR